jgi:hypothetical protein
LACSTSNEYFPDFSCILSRQKDRLLDADFCNLEATQL